MNPATGGSTHGLTHSASAARRHRIAEACRTETVETNAMNLILKYPASEVLMEARMRVLSAFYAPPQRTARVVSRTLYRGRPVVSTRGESYPSARKAAFALGLCEDTVAKAIHRGVKSRGRQFFFEDSAPEEVMVKVRARRATKH